MNLYLNGGLGDHVIQSGIPEAYYKLYGERTYIPNRKHPILFQNNPYLSDIPLGINNILNSERGNDNEVYYPVRVFRDITGVEIKKEEVLPNLYIEKEIQSDLCIVNDQAGWPTRWGYPYLQDLITDLMNMGWRMIYLRNDRFVDCNGTHSPRQISNVKPQDVYLDVPMETVVDLIKRAGLFVGYDSGLYQLSAALRVNSLLVAGSVNYVRAESPTSACVINTCRSKCHLENCTQMCIRNTTKYSNEVLEVCRGVLNGDKSMCSYVEQV